MLVNPEVDKVLNQFAKYVIQQSRSNLAKDEKAGGELYNTIGGQVSRTAEGFRLILEMEDYGKFQDKGVKGADPSKVSPNAKITGQQAANAPYKFGSGSQRGTFKSFVKRMSIFAKQKNIRFRQTKIVKGKKVSTGKYAKGGFDSVGYIIASNIYNRGIKPSMFFTKPFESAFKRLPQQILDAYSVGIEKQIQVNINKK
ncbi:MAG: hypothetical protein QNK89_00180 [Lacinutrix sp.]|uniref:hypothetical protein n=1 Tax=Lacinutrix sp. TaxID=1937692 RepID=UPI00309F6861